MSYLQNLKIILSALILSLFLINVGMAQIQSLGLNKTFFTASSVKKLHQENSNVNSAGFDKTFFITNNNGPVVEQSPIPAPPLTFESDGIVWAMYEEDKEYTSGNPANTRSEYLLFPINSFIDDNYIYHIWRTGLFQGSYISKRNLLSGDLAWDFSNNLSNNDKVELDFSLHKRSDGNIEVFGFRLLSNQFPNPNPTGVVNRKIFDDNSGELLDQFYTEYEEGGTICPNFGGQFGRIFSNTEDEIYTTSCSFANREKVVISMLSDQNGLFSDTTEVVSNLLNMDSSPKASYSDALQLPNGNIAVAVSVFNEFFIRDEIRSEVLILDQDGTLINRIDVTEIMDYTTYLNMNIVDDKIILSGTSFQDFINDNLITAANIAVLDEFGTVYAQINKIDDFIGLNAILLADGQLAAVGRSRDNKCLNILFEQDGQMQSVESMCHTDAENWYLSASYLKQYENQLLITGRIFKDTLLLDQNSGEVFADGAAIAPVILAFDLDAIGSVSTTDKKEVAEDLFSVSPNPVKDVINIDFKTAQTGSLQLINQLGEVVHDALIENTIQHRWPSDQLASGIYYVRFGNEKILSTEKIIITN